MREGGGRPGGADKPGGTAGSPGGAAGAEAGMGDGTTDSGGDVGGDSLCPETVASWIASIGEVEGGEGDAGRSLALGVFELTVGLSAR